MSDAITGKERNRERPGKWKWSHLSLTTCHVLYRLHRRRGLSKEINDYCARWILPNCLSSVGVVTLRTLPKALNQTDLPTRQYSHLRATKLTGGRWLSAKFMRLSNGTRHSGWPVYLPATHVGEHRAIRTIRCSCLVCNQSLSIVRELITKDQSMRWSATGSAFVPGV